MSHVKESLYVIYNVVYAKRSLYVIYNVVYAKRSLYLLHMQKSLSISYAKEFLIRRM